ncbi:unnamed protein product [Anisakis simplex]|uniref:IgGFc_binding domain-containing protein n=1 Tax=Anisakis simplex TaxID=6269 RepID=A0A0M3J9T1_ANISI|nr:unnamed protein product [Anisakis simplex]
MFFYLKANHKPVSSHIYVVPPSGVSFVISTGSWYLQKGSLYGISVSLLDSDDNIMLIPENARFETTVPEEYFEILEHSSNNTYFYVKAIKSGMATIRSTFLSVIDEDGHGISGLGEVNGEKMATISDAVEIWPKSIIFAYDSELSEQQSWTVEVGLCWKFCF